MAELRKRRSMAEGEDEGGLAEMSDGRNSCQRSDLQQKVENFHLTQIANARYGDEMTAQGSRLVAIGDIHGDLEQAKRVLGMMGLVDSGGKWIGDRATLVQTGDLVDRGSKSMAVVQFFEDLKLEAKAAGGRVHTLLGNHELMNLQSNFLYVSRRELGSLGAKNDLQLPSLFQEKLKQEHWFKILRLSSREEEKGLMLWWGSLQPDAWFGGVLRNLPVGAILGEGSCRTAFIHAGLTLQHLQSVDNTGTLKGAAVIKMLNEKVKNSLVRCPGQDCAARKQEGNIGAVVPGSWFAGVCFSICDLRNWESPVGVLLGVDGAVWYRGYQKTSDSELCVEVKKVLDRLGVHRIVVGHNLQVDKRVRTRCGGLIEMIDVGISRAYLGGLAAWECEKGQPSIRYPH